MINKQVNTLYERFLNALNVLKYSYNPKMIYVEIDYKKHEIKKWIKQYCDKHYIIYKTNIEEKYMNYVIYKLLTFVDIQKHQFLFKYDHIYYNKMKTILFGDNGNKNESKILIKQCFKYKQNNIHLNTKTLLFN